MQIHKTAVETYSLQKKFSSGQSILFWKSNGHDLLNWS